ncbi:MAG: replication fork clamp-binding protein CrfC [Candidatus Latescibacterota bacterium]|jgi:replication fork clamp-binding protein CrfC
MKKTAILIAIFLAPMVASAQNAFDSFENDKDVSSVVVTKNMFKLLSKIDMQSDDPEVQEYKALVENLDNIKVYTTENPDVASKMNAAVASYVSKSKGLDELMRVNDDGNNIKFYSKEGSNENFVSELLMHLQGDVEGKNMTVIMSITGNIDLKQISKLTKDLNVPGSDALKEVGNKKQ